MSYTAAAFFVFLFFAVLIYYVFPAKHLQWGVLLCASYFFYMQAGVKSVVYILFTTLSTYGAARIIGAISEKSKKTVKEHKQEWSREEKKAFKAQMQKKKKAVFLAGLLSNIGVLALVKYSGFFVSNMNGLFRFFHTGFEMKGLSLLVPLGISYYTFQSVGYLVDVYNGTVEAEKNPGKYALFVSFFPQIIQGPISFYAPLSQQLYKEHKFDFVQLKYGLELMLWGYFKKLMIADRAYYAVHTLSANTQQLGGLTQVFVLILYSLQLYADFSAGIDITRGIAQMFGVDLPDNFKRPYFATSVGGYWRRWHITLGAWMKQYVFYPLAMSRTFLNLGKKVENTRFGKTEFGRHMAKTLSSCLATVVLFVVVGIWHGASWNYVMYGIYNGVLLALEILLQPVFDGWTARLSIRTASPLFHIFRVLRTYLLVLVGYINDLTPSFRGTLRMMRAMCTDWNLMQTKSEIVNAFALSFKDYVIILTGTVFLFAVSFIQEKNPARTMRSMIDEKHFMAEWLVVFAGAILILIFGVYGPGYNAVEFVYMQF